MNIEIEQIVAIVLVVMAIGIPSICLLAGTIRLVLIGFSKGK